MLTVFSSATPETLAALKDELALRKASRFVLLFSMGSQFDHLIVPVALEARHILPRR